MTEPDEQPRVAEAPQSGATLAKAREARDLTIAAAAEALHLDVTIVEAMEQDRFADLGAPVFARGHLRKYASLVDVDAEQALAGFEAAQDPDVLPPVVPEVETRSATKLLTPMTAGIAGLLLLVVVLLAWFLGSAEPERASAEPPAATPSVAEATPTGVETAVEPSTIATRGVVEAPAAAAAATNQVSDEPANTETPISPSVDILVLSYTADCWTEVRDADGRQLYSATATEGARLVLEGLAPFDLVVGNRRAIAIELNGAAVPIPGSAIRGRTARFSTPGRDY